MRVLPQYLVHSLYISATHVNAQQYCNLCGLCLEKYKGPQFPQLALIFILITCNLTSFLNNGGVRCMLKKG